jgi:hypothetical protein
MKSPTDLGFYAAAAALARRIETTSARLAANGVRCATSFALSIRPEVAAMRASVARVSGIARVVSGTATTEPAIPVWRGVIGGRK